MNELIKIEKNSVKATDLHMFLEVKSAYNVWIGRKLKEFPFISGVDFQSFSYKSTGGRPLIEYALSIDMAKHIALAEKNQKGMQLRQYFIDIENKYRQQMLRDSSKLTRRGLTELIQDTGENERMHGHAFSTYTKLIYKKLGIEFTKEKNFRDTLAPDQLKAVEALEKMAEGYLRLGYDYTQIKQVLPEFITKKQEELE
jgi:phage anti-repressor protein